MNKKETSILDQEIHHKFITFNLCPSYEYEVKIITLLEISKKLKLDINNIKKDIANIGIHEKLKNYICLKFDIDGTILDSMLNYKIDLLLDKVKLNNRELTEINEYLNNLLLIDDELFKYNRMAINKFKKINQVAYITNRKYI